MNQTNWFQGCSNVLSKSVIRHRGKPAGRPTSSKDNTALSTWISGGTSSSPLWCLIDTNQMCAWRVRGRRGRERCTLTLLFILFLQHFMKTHLKKKGLYNCVIQRVWCINHSCKCQEQSGDQVIGCRGELGHDNWVTISMHFNTFVNNLL